MFLRELMVLWVMSVGFESTYIFSGKRNEYVGSVQDFIFWFCIWCKSRELRGRMSPRFPCVTPMMESFSSVLLRTIISYWTKPHLGSCQTSMMELFCKNSKGSRDFDFSRKNAPPHMFDWIPNAPPIEKGAVNAGCR